MKQARGRRAGNGDTKQSIADAAQRIFSEKGFTGATIRNIAENAKVDPALISHYFGSKQELFVAVMAPAYGRQDFLITNADSKPEMVADQLVSIIHELLGDHSTQKTAVAIIAAAGTQPQTAKLMRSFVTKNMVQPIVNTMNLPNAELRANLISAQIVGLIMQRFIIKLKPIDTAELNEITNLLKPALVALLSE